jgi:hypothetical protein
VRIVGGAGIAVEGSGEWRYKVGEWLCGGSVARRDGLMVMMGELAV